MLIGGLHRITEGSENVQLGNAPLAEDMINVMRAPGVAVLYLDVEGINLIADSANQQKLGDCRVERKK